MWWGKLLGGFFGYIIAGPLGAILGLLFGHSFDRGMNLRGGSWTIGINPRQVSEIQHAFFTATFSVMGKIAKSEGRVSENAIRVAESFIAQMTTDAGQRREAINLFNKGKQADFDVDRVLRHLVETCRGSRPLLQMFIEIQVKAAYQGGDVGFQKQTIIQDICQKLGCAPINFQHYEYSFGGQQRAYHEHAYRRPYEPPSQKSTLENAYQELGVSESSTKAEVKHAYRKLMSQNHPDKLVSKGLPEEMMKVAKEKTQNIQAAYDQICKARGF